MSQKQQILDLLDADNPNNHIPSLTDEDDAQVTARAYWTDEVADPADLAIRTCHCGVKIDGFYEYVDHLKNIISTEVQ